MQQLAEPLQCFQIKRGSQRDVHLIGTSLDIAADASKNLTRYGVSSFFCRLQFKVDDNFL